MVASAKKALNEKAEQNDTIGEVSPGEVLRRELLDVGKKSAKAGKLDEAIHHYLGAIILDTNLALATSNSAPSPTLSVVGSPAIKVSTDLLDQVRKLAIKAFGSDQRKLLVAFADVHAEINDLIAPIAKPIDLKTALSLFRAALEK